MRLHCLFFAFIRIMVGIAVVMLVSGCGGGGGSTPTPTISIQVPTSEPTWATTSTAVRIGGNISGASFAHIVNTTTGFRTEAYVIYAGIGIGTWFADVSGLVPGDNLITVTADANGDGVRTASDQITVSRPLQPYTLIINAPDGISATHYWVDASSFGRSHKIALFGDGNGIATTGNDLTENASATAAFTWHALGPDGIQIDNCLTCSFQQITRISGSANEGQFLGQIQTIGGDGELALHAFLLEAGTL